ncbi:MAG: glycosyltransferase [Pseudomonadota bacterium]|nr:glycosyltransferase [Pseudomonadota bacterium]
MNYSVFPLVSVIIPTYNRASYLGRALQSILDQTYTNWEVIVIDNHSTDNTDEVMVSFVDQRITFLKIQNNGVIAKSRNAGILAAKGECIAFLDSDDWWLPNKLEESVFHLDSGADIVYHDLYMVKSRFQRWYWQRYKTFQLHTPVFNDLLERGNAIANSSVVIRKSLLEKVGGLTEEENMVAGEDYDCWLRVAKHTERFFRLEKTLGYYWSGGGNITSSEQTKILLFEFRKRYLLDYCESIPAWYHYQMGKIQYHHSYYNEAASHFYNALVNENSLIQKLKIILKLVSVYYQLFVKAK